MSELVAYPLLVTDKKDKIIIDDEKMPFEIWKAFTMPPNSDENYFFTKFGMMLNNLPDELKARIAPTDSRLRPDQRALE